MKVGWPLFISNIYWPYPWYAAKQFRPLTLHKKTLHSTQILFCFKVFFIAGAKFATISFPSFLH